MKKLFFLLIIIVLLSLVFSYFKKIKAEGEVLPIPEEKDWQEAWHKFISFFPELFKKIWQGILKVWRIICQKLKEFWNTHIWPKIEWLWQKILSFFGKKVEEEKTEIKEGAIKAQTSLWERIKNLFKLYPKYCATFN